VRRLLSCRRGSVATEFIVAFGPLTIFFFSIWQESLLTSGQSLTQHAAVAAARSATVVLPDDPARYGGSAANSVSPQRSDAVRAAAVRAMSPLVFDETVTDVQVAFPGATGQLQPGQDITVKVTATFRCVLPLAKVILCGTKGTMPLTAEATLPVQAARYQY
jgi:hypothetical protein